MRCLFDSEDSGGFRGFRKSPRIKKYGFRRGFRGFRIQLQDKKKRIQRGFRRGFRIKKRIQVGSSGTPRMTRLEEPH